PGTDVTEIRRIEEGLPVARETECLEHTPAGRELDRSLRGTVDVDGVVADPLLGLLLKDHALAGPDDRGDVRERPIVRLVVPEFLRVAGREICDHERDRMAAREGSAVQPVGAHRHRVIRGTTAAASTSAAAARDSAPATLRRRRSRRAADAAHASLRLLRERCARPADERDALAV